MSKSFFAKIHYCQFIKVPFKNRNGFLKEAFYLRKRCRADRAKPNKKFELSLQQKCITFFFLNYEIL
jgi:hypothetical protein